MAARKAKKKARKKKGSGPVEMIISKSRTKNAVQNCKVSSEFYGALDAKVREIIAQAEVRAEANRRGTLRPQDI